LTFLLYGIQKLLPPGGRPLYDQAWYSFASGDYANAVYLPYRVSGGTSLLITGQPEGNYGAEFDMHIRIWDWQDAGLNPTLWQEIRPMMIDIAFGSGSGSFLGRDENGQWWAIVIRIDLELSKVNLLGVMPVTDPDRFQVKWMEGLDPKEAGLPNLEHFIVRDGDHVILYKIENMDVRKVWSEERVMVGRFRLDPPHDYGVDLTGDKRPEMLIIWEEGDPPSIDVYQINEDESDIIHWLGRFDSRLQFYDVTGDGLPDFLQPDNAEDPTEWQVISWNGNAFMPGGKFSRPQSFSPSPTNITYLGNLPPLPSNIIFRRQDFYQWWLWSWRGGWPEKMSKPPNQLGGDCSFHDYGGYGEACYSPAGRYKLVDIPAPIEGSDTGILDGITGNRVRIPDSFTYTQGYNTFAWSPDEKFLLMAQGDGIARLAKINPVSGERTIVWESSSGCGLERSTCSILALTDPVVFTDGSFGFAIQSSLLSAYPPPGIYRLSPDGELTMLVALPHIDESKGLSKNLPPYAPIYGYLLWSPDKSTFLYYDFFVGNKSGLRVLLLGRADGSALWDLRDIGEPVHTIREFRWE